MRVARRLAGSVCIVVAGALVCFGASRYRMGASAPHGRTRPATESWRVGSAIAIDPLGRGTWIVDEENEALILVSASGGRTVFPVGAWPEQLVVDPAGRVYVSCRQAGRIDIIEPDRRRASLELAGEPRALALDASLGRLYVGLVTARQVVEVETSTLQIVSRASLPAAPYVLARVGVSVAALPRLGDSLYLLSAADLSDERRLELPSSPGRKSWHGQALVPDGRDLYIVYATVDTGGEQPPRPGGYGGAFSLPVINQVALLKDGRAPYIAQGVALLPAGDITGGVVQQGALTLASRAAQTLIRVASPDVLVVPSPAVFGRLVPGVGPGLRGVALAQNGTVETFAAFDRELVRGYPRYVERVDVGDGKLEARLARGRALFYGQDLRISNRGLTCATCHPDGREDGLVWRFESERLQTPMLASALSLTAPYHWHGTSPTLENSIVHTLARLGGAGLSDDDLEALADYLKTGLRAPRKAPSNEDPVLVAMGRELFNSDEVGCGTCHVDDGSFADGQSHDVGTADGLRSQHLSELDTPSLRDVALTPPYLHDGSAPTLEAVLDRTRDRMGHTSQLSAAQEHALVAYLKTL